MRRVVQAVGAVPVDLIITVGFALFAVAIVLGVARGSPVAGLVGLALVLFFPGYVVVAALFPGDGRVRVKSSRLLAVRRRTSRPEHSITDRFALSFGLSVALLPLFGVFLALLSVPFTPVTIVSFVAAFILIGAAIGTVRRIRLPPEDRFYVPIRQWYMDVMSFLTGGESHVETGVRVALAMSIIIVTSALVFGVVAPAPSAEYDTLLLLTRSDGGDFVASGYPTNMTRGTSAELVVGLENHRDERSTYTVVVELQRTRTRGARLLVVQQRELDRFRTSLAPGETWYHRHNVTPRMVGEQLRLVYYLYRGDVPTTVSEETAQDHVYLWVNVSLPA